MSLKKEATTAHLIVGIILVTISISLVVINFISPKNIWGLFIHIPGVWGGVEIGRFLESKIQGKLKEKSI